MVCRIVSTIFFAAIVSAVVAQPSIEVDGQNINVDLENNGVFTIGGNAVGMNSDITAAVSTITDQSQRVDRLERQLNTGDDPSAPSIADVVNSIAEATSDISGNMTSIAQTQTTISEGIEGIEASANRMIMWNGVKYNTSECTTDSCILTIYGRGFIALPTEMENDIYTISVSLASTSQDCPVTNVAPTYIQCDLNWQSPPSATFSVTLSVLESGTQIAYVSGVPPANLVQLTAVGPVVNFDGADVAFLSTGANPPPVTIDGGISDPDHPADSLNVNWQSSDQSILPNSGISFNAGVLSLQFSRYGLARVSVSVSDSLGFTASGQVTVLHRQERTCSSTSQVNFQSCVQTPIDIHWGLGTTNCAPLINGGIFWNPTNGRHIRPSNGVATLSLSPQTVTSISIFQLLENYQHGLFEIWLKDIDALSPTNGEYVRIFTAGASDTIPSNGPTVVPVPAQYRFTDSIQFRTTSTPKNFDFYRLMEIQALGC